MELDKLVGIKFNTRNLTIERAYWADTQVPLTFDELEELNSDEELIFELTAGIEALGWGSHE